MSESRQQSSEGYPYEVVTLPNTVPPMPHSQPTSIPRGCAGTIHPVPKRSQGDTETVPPPVAQHGYSEPLYVGYPQHSGSYTPSDGTTHIRHTQCAPLPIEQNNITPAQPTGLAPPPAATTANGPPLFDNPIGRMPENAPIPSGRLPNGTTQGFSDTGYNPAIPMIWMANVYRAHAMELINNPRSNVVGMHMESRGGRSRVTIELDISDAA